MKQGNAISRTVCVVALLITDVGAAITATEILVPPQAYATFTLLSGAPQSSKADELGNLPGQPVDPTPQQAGLAHCRGVHPSWTLQITCGPGQFPCGFACFDQDGHFAGRAALNQAGIAPST